MADEYSSILSLSGLADPVRTPTEKQQKNVKYNENKTEVGSALKTLNGSIIRRSKFGVGKYIGGQYYFHRKYAEQIIPRKILSQAVKILGNTYPDFQYNAMMYQPSKSIIRFDQAPDFDIAREPKTGDYISVDISRGTTRKGHSNYIWHHKWLWVDKETAIV